MQNDEKRSIEDVEQECFACGRRCVNRRSLGNHVNRSHPEIGGLLGYTLRYVCHDETPRCMCGCGSDVTWHKLLYKFNDYLTGHNPAGFKVTQPVFTDLQLEKRKESIKKAYEERGEEIRTKISRGVIEAQKSSGTDFSSYFREKWSDENFRKAQRESRIKSWQGEAGDKRREKVFTPEFGKKISMANMSRESHTKSAVEESFARHLESIGLQVERSKWFNFEKKTWCADVWLPVQGTIVEFDGSYWHGLDRDSDYTYDQVINMTNDLIKNSLAKEKNLNLIRVKEGTDISSIKKYEDLIESAHHVVLNGAVIKEGTIHLKDDTTPIFTRTRIIKTSLRENGKKEIENYVPVIQNFLKAYVDYWGWFYPRSDDSLVDVLKAIERSSDVLNMSTSGSEWLKSRSRAYWSVDDGPVQKFKCDKTLKSVILYRAGINNSKKYSYSIEGREIQCNETFDITFKNVRNGFIVRRNKVSWFKPSWAAHIYKKFCHNIDKPTVWDPSIGFSARMLGFAAVFDSGTYIGTDPAKMTHEDAVLISKEINSIKPKIKFDLRREGSENTNIDPCSVDLVFTSPPYFDTEKYFNESGQCWLDYPTIEEWNKFYLSPTLAVAKQAIRPNGKVVINISEKFRDLIVNTATSKGLKLEDTIVLHVNADHFARSLGRTAKIAECFLIFSLP